MKLHHLQKKKLSEYEKHALTKSYIFINHIYEIQVKAISMIFSFSKCLIQYIVPYINYKQLKASLFHYNRKLFQIVAQHTNLVAHKYMWNKKYLGCYGEKGRRAHKISCLLSQKGIG